MKRLTILLVDHWSVIKTLGSYLQEQGHEVLTTTDGVDGWKKFIEHDVDLVIADLHLPNIEGSDLDKNIHGVSPTTPIILHSIFEEPRSPFVNWFLPKNDISSFHLMNAIMHQIFEE